MNDVFVVVVVVLLVVVVVVIDNLLVNYNDFMLIE